MKYKKRLSQSEAIRKTLLRDIQSELKKLDPEALQKLKEDSAKNALLVEAIKSSMKGKIGT